MHDSLGDRMKRYERVASQHLTPNIPIVVRVDGRAFHTYTKNMNRPFDSVLMDAMYYAMVNTCDGMAGAVLAYTQSDECSFLLRDDRNFDTQQYFGGNRDKIITITASTFTAYFNEFMSKHSHPNVPAIFDGRAFSLPLEDAPNYFIWRWKDWERNSLQMLSRAYFSHSELDGKRREDMHEMLHGIGVNWANLSERNKNGQWWFPQCKVGGSMVVNYKLLKNEMEWMRDGD